jgi:hypothetical protein
MGIGRMSAAGMEYDRKPRDSLRLSRMHCFARALIRLRPADQ